MFFIDSDNALGSWFGDVDDAFAIAALLRSGAPVSAISAVAGNTSEPRAFANNCALARLAGYEGPLLHGHEVARFLGQHPGLRVVALGPLTNVAAALRAGASVAEVIIVGGNLSSRGRWPPWWPHEFNLTKDGRAALDVFHAEVPLTIFPLDVAGRLAVGRAEIAELRGNLGAYLQRGTRRWLIRLLLLKARPRFPIYDLSAALYALDAAGCTMETTVATMGRNTFIREGPAIPPPRTSRITGPTPGTRVVNVCRALDRDLLWARFRALLDSR